MYTILALPVAAEAVSMRKTRRSTVEVEFDVEQGSDEGGGGARILGLRDAKRVAREATEKAAEIARQGQKAVLLAALEKTRGHQGEAAELLGVSPATVKRWIHGFVDKRGGQTKVTPSLFGKGEYERIREERGWQSQTERARRKAYGGERYRKAGL